tara:strand:+ start:124 stop:777 length:654 start_codon:yes stop_codon:yes gene_type:complete
MIRKNLKNRVVTSIGLLILFILIAKYQFLLISCLFLVGTLSLVEFYSLIGKIIKNKILLFLSNFSFTFFIFIFCFLFFLFSNFVQLKLILFSILLACIGSDIGGYVIGKIFQGPKLYKKVSPNKTISGSIGSIIFSCFFIFTSILYFTESYNLKIIFVGIVTSIACQLGDLFFSYLKRKAKVKDTGNILPGHGGVLDRLDGIFLGIPFGFITLTLIY